MMLSVIDSSVNLMRERHKKGELYYWILYYSYLSPHRYENTNEILYVLDDKGFPLSLRTYYSRREEALTWVSFSPQKSQFPVWPLSAIIFFICSSEKQLAQQFITFFLHPNIDRQVQDDASQKVSSK